MGKAMKYQESGRRAHVVTVALPKMKPITFILATIGFVKPVESQDQFSNQPGPSFLFRLQNALELEFIARYQPQQIFASLCSKKNLRFMALYADSRSDS